MQVQLARWGNSLGVRIPKDFVGRLGLTEGMRVQMETEENRIVIVVDRPRYDLSELLVGMTPDAMHGVFDWGVDVGREVVD